MSEPPFDAADRALLEQGVRGLRDDLPDDARMRRLERRLGPLLSVEAPNVRWWQRRQLHVFAGVAIVLCGVIAGARREVASSPSSPAPTAQSPADEVTRAPTLAPPAPEPPVVSVDSLPTVAIRREPSGSEPKVKRASDAIGERDPRPAEDPGDELALLEEARNALGGDPARTLALADTHAKRFVRPSFVQERERLAIEALVRLDRRAEAEERANRFEATYPHSAHLARVRALVSARVAP